MPACKRPQREGVDMDSGCTQHMTNRKEWLKKFRASPIPYVLLGDEGKLLVKGEGDLVLQSVYGEVKLDNVLLVDKLTLNLLNQSQLDSGGCKIFSDKGCLWVFGSDWKVIAEGSRKQGLYEMKLHENQSGDKVTYLAEPEAGKVAREELRTKLEKVPIKELQQQAFPMAAAVSTVDINLLHWRMGHAGYTRLKELVKKNMAAGAKVADGGEENLKCSTCVEAKATKAPHPKVATTVSFADDDVEELPVEKVEPCFEKSTMERAKTKSVHALEQG
ncbi:unnamed protein product [Closterium sp. NIES-53]